MEASNAKYFAYVGSEWGGKSGIYTHLSMLHSQGIVLIEDIQAR